MISSDSSKIRSPSGVGTTPLEMRRKIWMPISSSMDLMIALRVVWPIYSRFAAAEMDRHRAISFR